MYLLIPALLGRGWPFGLALATGCALTIALYLAMTRIAARIDPQL